MIRRSMRLVGGTFAVLGVLSGCGRHSGPAPLDGGGRPQPPVNIQVPEDVLKKTPRGEIRAEKLTIFFSEIQRQIGISGSEFVNIMENTFEVACANQLCRIEVKKKLNQEGL